MADLLNEVEEENEGHFIPPSQGHFTQPMHMTKYHLVHEYVDFDKAVDDVVNHYRYHPIVMQVNSCQLFKHSSIPRAE